MGCVVDMPVDQFAHWRARLAGQAQEVHADSPRPGYYGFWSGEKWVPVAIWMAAGTMMGRRGGEMVEPLDVWPACAGFPVPEADAMAAFTGDGGLAYRPVVEVVDYDLVLDALRDDRELKDFLANRVAALVIAGRCVSGARMRGWTAGTDA